MSFLPPLELNWDAALRDVNAKSPKFRRLAAERLKKADATQRAIATQKLTSLLDDKDATVRMAALDALGELGAAQAVAQVIDRFDDPHQQVRQLAACIAAELDPRAATPALRRLLTDPRPEMRFQAVTQLSGIEDADVRATPLVRDDDPLVRAAAIDGFGRDLGTATLQRCLSDDDAQVAFNAAVALAERGISDGQGVLIDALDSTRALDAIGALGHLDSPEASKALSKMATRFWLSPALRAEVGGAIGRRDPDLGAKVLRRVMRGWRIEGKNRAIQLASELRLQTLVPDIHAIVGKPGVDSDTAGQAITELSQA